MADNDLPFVIEEEIQDEDIHVPHQLEILMKKGEVKDKLNNLRVEHGGLHFDADANAIRALSAVSSLGNFKMLTALKDTFAGVASTHPELKPVSDIVSGAYKAVYEDYKMFWKPSGTEATEVTLTDINEILEETLTVISDLCSEITVMGEGGDNA